MRFPLLTLALLSLLFSLLNLQAAPVTFESEVLPFLKEKCLECHREPHPDKKGKMVKPKAGLRMDGAWAIVAGSEDGPVLKAGNAAKSELFLRVTLPVDDDDFMPPQGKADPLTPAELDLFKRWINEGADFGGWVGNTKGQPEDPVAKKSDLPNAATSVKTGSETQKIYARLAEGLTPADEKLLASVTSAGARVTPLAPTSPLLSVDFRTTAVETTDASILLAQAVAANIAHLDLSHTSATDAALALVAETPRLVRLDLSNTAIGDEGLKQLSGLRELRYLNLHATAVTDAGLESLRSLKQLNAVYLWQSKVTEEGAKKLRTALPDARIITQ